MKIQNNLVQQQVSSSNTNSPSFNAKFACTRGAKAYLREEWSEIYENCTQKELKYMFNSEPFDFKKLFINYKKAVETATKDVKGTIKLYKDGSSAEQLNLKFKFPHEKYLYSKMEKGQGNCSSELMLPHSLYDKGLQLSRSVKFTMAGLADVLDDNSIRQNPFKKLFAYYNNLKVK